MIGCLHRAASHPLTTTTNYGLSSLLHEAPWFIPLMAFSAAGMLYSILLDTSPVDLVDLPIFSTPRGRVLYSAYVLRLVGIYLP